jgi:hypothetical protein
MLDTIRQGHYANLTNPTLVIRSSRTSIAKAINEMELDNPVVRTSYLILCLCYKEYCHATNFTDRSLDPDGYEIIAQYYNRIASEQSEGHLLMFAESEIEPILERVGAAIRANWGN